MKQAAIETIKWITRKLTFKNEGCGKCSFSDFDNDTSVDALCWHQGVLEISIDAPLQKCKSKNKNLKCKHWTARNA